MVKEYLVVSGFYNNKTLQNEFIQGIGAYWDRKQAYGAAILHLNSLCDADETAAISPLYELEGEAGFGMSLKHGGGKFTDYAYVLFSGEEDERRHDRAPLREEDQEKERQES